MGVSVVTVKFVLVISFCFLRAAYNVGSYRYCKYSNVCTNKFWSYCVQKKSNYRLISLLYCSMCLILQFGVPYLLHNFKNRPLNDDALYNLVSLQYRKYGTLEISANISIFLFFCGFNCVLFLQPIFQSEHFINYFILLNVLLQHLQCRGIAVHIHTCILAGNTIYCCY